MEPILKGISASSHTSSLAGLALASARPDAVACFHPYPKT